MMCSLPVALAVKTNYKPPMPISPATPLFNPQDFHLPPDVSHVCAGDEVCVMPN